MKKIIICFLMLNFLTPAVATAPDIKIIGVTTAGALLCAGGTYKLCKPSKSCLASFLEVASGTALFCAGITLILISESLVCDDSINLK